MMLSTLKCSSNGFSHIFKCYFLITKWVFYRYKAAAYVLCSTLYREPSFGHFNKDGILDVVVEDDIGHYKKRVAIFFICRGL